MRIVIDTDGTSTKVYFNGREQTRMTEVNISVRGGKKVKMQMVQHIDGAPQFMSYFGEDFKKYDEVQGELK